MPDILIVDDDDLARLALVKMVRNAGYTPVPLDNGDEAVRHYQNHPTAAVLLDLMISGTDGFEILRQLRALDPQVNVIGMHVGEFTPEQIADMSRFLGLRTALLKPFSTADLASTLRGVVPGASESVAP